MIWFFSILSTNWRKMKKPKQFAHSFTTIFVLNWKGQSNRHLTFGTEHLPHSYINDCTEILIHILGYKFSNECVTFWYNFGKFSIKIIKNFNAKALVTETFVRLTLYSINLKRAIPHWGNGQNIIPSSNAKKSVTWCRKKAN